MDGNDQMTEFLTGYPNNFQNIKWPNYEANERLSLKISVEPAIFSGYRNREVAFWNDFLPDLLKVSRIISFILCSISQIQTV